MMKTITVVIPVFNEAGAIVPHLETILATTREVAANFQFLIIDDGSSDNTAKEVHQLCEKTEEVELICLSRNFGKEAAIFAGITHAQGDAVIVMDSDLQHPPELIEKMIQLWHQGIDVVEAYKASRGKETWTSNILANGFYSLFKFLSGMDIKNHSDFKLLDRRVVDVYCRLPERKRFFRGLVHWMGFSTAKIPFEVPERQAGSSAWSRLRLLKFSLTAITSFSSLPLQIITLLGFFFLLITMVIGGISLYDKFVGHAVSGFTTVILLLLLIGGFIMIGLGLIGIYLAHIYDEIKARPSFLINWRKSSIESMQQLPPDDYLQPPQKQEK